MSDVASSSTLEEHALHETWWHVELPNGVCRMTAAALEEAHRDGVVDAETPVLPPGSTSWTCYGEIADPFDSEPQAYPALGTPYEVEPSLPVRDSHYASVPPMATDLAPSRERPPARFDGAFGPAQPPDAELRTRRLIFAGVLCCALAGGFFTATGTSGLRALGARLTGRTTAVPPPPAASPAPPPAVQTWPSADPSKPLAPPPPTGIASTPPPPKTDAAPRRKRRHH
jgi:hypothetical protein